MTERTSSGPNQIERGMVIKAHSGFFTVHLESDSTLVTCQVAGRLTQNKHTVDVLAIGDWVWFEPVRSEGNVNGRIVAVEPRLRVLSRKDPIAGTKEQDIQQVLVANLELVTFVFACSQPDFHPRLLDRYLVGAEAQRIPVLVCANKVDLVGLDLARQMFSVYEKIGYRVLYTSMINRLGIDELYSALHGKLSVLTGKSGVGKTSLLNCLIPGLGKEVGDMSVLLHKGKHTTVVPELLQLDSTSWIADTPGLRSYAIWDVEAGELDAYYREIAPYVSQCLFSDCTHIHEPGCAVIAAVERSEIPKERYESYRRLRLELDRQRKW